MCWASGNSSESIKSQRYGGGMSVMEEIMNRSGKNRKHETDQVKLFHKKSMGVLEVI
jgi:hypothetical protein